MRKNIKDGIEDGLNKWLKGWCFPFDKVVFCPTPDGHIQIISYSEYGELVDSSIEEARKMISRSKKVYVELCDISDIFRNDTKDLKHEYLFCFDYGNGAAQLATEENGSLILNPAWKVNE